MGFSLQIQAEYGGEILMNLHPEGKPSGGKAVFAFLSGLYNHCEGMWDEEDDPLMRTIYEWYRGLEQSAGASFCPTCRALLDCMWGDGGDPTEYREDEYEYYRKRCPNIGDSFTKEMFQEMLRQSRERWKPIGEVIRGVQWLVDLFERSKLEPLEGFYEPGDTKPDFEALLANLRLLAKRGNTVVRLNFN